MKFSLTYKMMLVVAIPLALQLIFLVLLSSNLKELASEQNIVQHNARVVRARDQIVINERLRTVLATLYLSTLDPFSEQKYREVCADSPSVFRDLANLWKDEPEKIEALSKLSKLNAYRDRITTGAFGNTPQKQTLEELLGGNAPNSFMVRRSLLMKTVPYVEPYYQQALREKDAAYKRIAERLDLLHILLYGGLVASVVAAILSEFLFSRSVTKRLSLVLKNIKAFGEHRWTFGTIPGSDEIASLNETVISTANRIKDAEEFQAQTIAIIAEELNKPLTEVQAILHQLPETGFEQLSEKGTKRLHDSLAEIKRLEKLVFELVNLDSINRKMDIAHIEFDAMVENCLKIVEPLTKLKSISTAVHGVKGAEGYGDSAKTTQVLINLLSNAIKYSPEGSTIELTITATAQSTKLEIRDQGAGIPVQFQSKIFQRFEQANEAAKPSNASSGLGLMISKEIIESQGGEIGFESRTGEGANFWFTLPTTKIIPDSPKASTQAEDEKGWKPTLWKKALLVVALPVVVQTITIATTFNILNQYSGKVTQTENISQMTSLTEKLMTGISRAGLFAILYNVERDPKDLANARFEQSELQKNITQLDELTANDATTKELTSKLIATIKAHFHFQNNVIAAKPNADTSTFIGVGGSEKRDNLLIDTRKPLQDLFFHQNMLIESDTQTLSYLRQNFETLVFPSAIAASLAAALVGLFVAKTLTNKATLLSKAALQFSNNRELSKPSTGEDELSYVDQQLYLASKKLMDLEVARAEMVGITSHELRTPLTSLIALIEITEAGVFGTLTAQGEQLLAAARLKTSELIVLITNLLDLEKMESGKVLVTKQKINIENVFEQVKFDNAQSANTKQVVLNIIDCKQEIDGDSHRLSQALTAVIRSILERIPEKSSVSLQCTKVPGAIVLTIAAPHGTAVGRRNKTKEFARETMAISLARMTARQHGGDLNMTTSNKGRMFEMKLPLN